MQLSADPDAASSGARRIPPARRRRKAERTRAEQSHPAFFPFDRPATDEGSA